jgi:hypothetical protein
MGVGSFEALIAAALAAPFEGGSKRVSVLNSQKTRLSTDTWPFTTL